jgi:hypothetical protein
LDLAVRLRPRVLVVATNLFPATYPGLSGSTYLLMALVATASFFGSILVHELRQLFVDSQQTAAAAAPPRRATTPR